MNDDVCVEREIELEGSAAELWELVATADGWRQWLVDDAAIEIEVGGVGEVVDDSVHRHVRVVQVEPERSVTFHWWEHDDPSSVSEVVIGLVGLPGGGCHRVHIVERPLQPLAFARSTQQSMWEVRACLLALSVHARARV